MPPSENPNTDPTDSASTGASNRWTMRRRGDRRSRRRRQPGIARSAVRGVLKLQFGAALGGSLVVFLYLRILFPARFADSYLERGYNIGVLGIYLFLTVIVAIPINARTLNKAVAWIKEGREPSEEERRDTLTQPIRQTASAMAGWIGAAVIFGIINEDALRVGAGITVAGIVTCSMLYLLLERHFRPTFAVALEGVPLPENRRDILPKLMLAWGLGSALPLLAVGLAPLVIPETDNDLTWRGTVLIISAIVAGGLVMRAAAGSVANPINRVRDALRRVEEGDLDTFVPVDDLGELGRLAEGFNAMVEGLKERGELFALLDQQVGSDVARHALSEKPELGGGRQELSVLFVDLRGFTSFTEAQDPEVVVSMLNQFFTVVDESVTEFGGNINKFEGDAALCIFGAPVVHEDHAERALSAAITIQDQLQKFGDVPDVGIGVATGNALAGYVGTTNRYEYTVIGDAVNVASRLSDLAKDSDSPILATAISLRGIESNEQWVGAGEVQLRGKSQPTSVVSFQQ